MLKITCKCGHTAGYAAFEAEEGTFRCPACRAAWRVVIKGEGQQFASGLYVPPEQEIEELDAGFRRHDDPAEV